MPEIWHTWPPSEWSITVHWHCSSHQWGVPVRQHMYKLRYCLRRVPRFAQVGWFLQSERIHACVSLPRRHTPPITCWMLQHSMEQVWFSSGVKLWQHRHCLAYNCIRLSFSMSPKGQCIDIDRFDCSKDFKYASKVAHMLESKYNRVYTWKKIE